MIKYIILILFIIISIFVFINPIIIRPQFEKFKNSNDIISDMYVITLGKKERIDNIKKQEAKINDRIIRFKAVNGLKLDINELIKNDILDKNYKLCGPKNGNRTKREIGCYLSHLNIYKKIKKDNKNGYTIVFEDDFLVKSPNLKDDIRKSIDKLNNKNIDFDYLYLGSDKINYGENIIDNLYYVNPKQHLFGTHAYVINNKKIDKIIDNVKIIKRPIDVAIKDLSNNRIFTTIIMYPNTVIQNKSFKSTVNNKSDVI
jgi:GR25 family glycosyltransferase involved in LPS biosynthesis